MKTAFTIIITGMVAGISMSYSQNFKNNLMKPFKITIQQVQIVDLKHRINQTRWIAEPENPGWGSSLGVQFLKELANYWTNEYDWKKHEMYLNRFNQYKAKVDGTNIHFVYEKGTGTKHIPLLLLHGWAANFTEYIGLLELIKKENPELDVIIPSLPGFGFSETPDTMSSETVASIIHKLMVDVLGYKEYYVHGGDFGGFVAERIAMDNPSSVKGLHLSDIPYYHFYGYNENLSEDENKFMEKINNWSMMDGAYAMIQGTKPKVLATGLNDSPMGLAAWLIQLFSDFSNKEEYLFEKFNRDELLTNASIYWFTGSIYSSMRIYSEDSNGFGQPFLQKVTVPTGFNFFPFDISGIPPREFAGRFYENITSWNEQKSGGHFGALSNPELLYEDLIKFIKLMEK
jgi:pimeloyl-ACP methyl ester carboxylesterase